MHRQVPDGGVCFPIPCGHGHRSVIPVTTAGSVYLAFSVESGLGRARRRREPITDWHASTRHHDGAEDRATAPRRHRRRARGCARCERRGLGRDPPSDVGESDGGAAGSAENASETPSAGPTTNVAVPDAAWADGAHEAWSIAAEGWQALLGIDEMRFDSRTNVHVGERTIISLSPKTLVDVDTGEAFDLSSDDYASVSATTDGWIAYNGSEYTIPSVYSPSEGGEVMMALLDSPFSPESARIVGAWTLADQRGITFPGSNMEKSTF